MQKLVHGMTSPTTVILDKLAEVSGFLPYWFMLRPDEGDQVKTPEETKIGLWNGNYFKLSTYFPKKTRSRC
ncbi:MAG: hypothetical protein ACR5LF_11785 [Symbiopectobacterium sp.]